MYQVEHLRYADAPSHGFLDGVPTPGVEMQGAGETYAAMGETLKSEYNALRARLEAGESLEIKRL